VDGFVLRPKLVKVAADGNDVPVGEGGIKRGQQFGVVKLPVLVALVVGAVEVGVFGLAVNDQSQDPVVPNTLLKVPPRVVEVWDDAVDDVFESGVSVRTLLQLEHTVELAFHVVEVAHLAPVDDVAVVGVVLVVVGELDDDHGGSPVVFGLDLFGVEAVDESDQPILHSTPIFFAQGLGAVDDNDHVENWLPGLDDLVGLDDFTALAHISGFTAVFAIVRKLLVQLVGDHNVDHLPAELSIQTRQTWRAVSAWGTLGTLLVAVHTVSASFTLRASLTNWTPRAGSTILTPETNHTLNTGPTLGTSFTPGTGLTVGTWGTGSAPVAWSSNLSGSTGLASGTSVAFVAGWADVAGPAFAAHLTFDTGRAHRTGPTWLTGSTGLTGLTLPTVLANDTRLAGSTVLAGLAIGDVLAVETVGTAVAGLAVNAVDAIGTVVAVDASAASFTGFTLTAGDTHRLRREGAGAFAGLAILGLVVVFFLDASHGLFDLAGSKVGVFAAVAKADHGLNQALRHGQPFHLLEVATVVGQFFRDAFVADSWLP